MKRLLALSFLVGCTPSTPPVLHAEAMQGPVAGPPGKVLVMSATCGSVEHECRDTWAPAVDNLVMAGLEFHGFVTIDPAALRKDERTRSETTNSASTETHDDTKVTEAGVGVIAIIPIAHAITTHTTEARLVESHQKTVVLEGASFEDLLPEDRQRLTQMAGAGSILTTRITVGANYSNWTVAQNVEVMVKLASPASGQMLWATRCSASSGQYASVDAAIEAAARCAVTGMTGAPR